MKRYVAKDKECKNILLFFGVLLVYMCWILSKGDMISGGGDAADIWKTIQTYYSDDIYPSYVLYKGFMTVYPYVWLYQLAKLLDINEFFFVMLYHGILFSYIATIGVPFFIRKLTGIKQTFVQKVIFSVLIFSFWKTSRALDLLVVDLPSCALFIMTCNILLRWKEKREWIYSVILGILCGVCAGISGQYSVSILCVVICYIINLINMVIIHKKKKIVMLNLFGFICGSISVAFLSFLFYVSIVEGMPIPGKEDWLNRGLLYMIDKYRIFSGMDIKNERGFWILADVLGNEQVAKNIVDGVGNMGISWNVITYLKVVLRYPIDFIMTYIDSLFVCFSVDFNSNNLFALIISYSLLYGCLYKVSKMRKMREALKDTIFLWGGVLASIIPCLVLAVEMRYAITLQAAIWGYVILGTDISKLGLQCKNSIMNFKEVIAGEKSMLDLKIPWGIVFGIIFVFFCITHMGDLYAQSGLGTNMLFR